MMNGEVEQTTFPRNPLDVLAQQIVAIVATKSRTADELYVTACWADEGPTMKRFRPRAQGRAGSILKRTSHITVVVAQKG